MLSPPKLNVLFKQKLKIQERAVNAVKAAIKPYFQKNEINKDEYKEIVRKAVEKVSLVCTVYIYFLFYYDFFTNIYILQSIIILI